MARQFLFELFENGAAQKASQPSPGSKPNPRTKHQDNKIKPASRKTLSVSELGRALRQQLESVFADLWVQGEISGLRQYASGHWYFTLQDERAQISGVMFAADNRKLKFKVKDGDTILARGRLSFYEKSGRAQLVVRSMEPWGAGARALALKQLGDKLRREGLFDDAKKRPIPFVPRCLGVVTSPDGAALHDVITVTRRRFANMPIILSPTRVQGQSAPQEIAQALRRLDQSGLCDVIIIGRGGGSEEDLSVFSTEVVVRAVAACQSPVISAVGHEVDIALCDHAADLRAATPSAAAERAIPIKQDLVSGLVLHLHAAQRKVLSQIKHERYRLDSLRQILSDPSLLIYLRRQDLDTMLMRLQHRLETRLRTAQHKLEGLQYRVQALNPKKQLSPKQAELTRLQLRQQKAIALCAQNNSTKLQTLQGQLLQNMEQKISLCKAKLSVFSKQLHALSPLLVLSRGYAVVRREQTVISQSEQLKAGDNLDITFDSGQARVLVKSIQRQTKMDPGKP